MILNLMKPTLAYQVIFNFEDNNRTRLTTLFNRFAEIRISPQDPAFHSFLSFLKDTLKINRQYVPIQIPIQRDTYWELVNVTDIRFLEVYHRTVLIHCIKDDYEINGDLTSLSFFLQHLGFQRIHRSYLISTHHIEKYSYTDVILDNNQSLPIGKTYQKTVHAYLKKRYSLKRTLAYSIRL